MCERTEIELVTYLNKVFWIFQTYKTAENKLLDGDYWESKNRKLDVPGNNELKICDCFLDTEVVEQ